MDKIPKFLDEAIVKQAQAAYIRLWLEREVKKLGLCGGC